MADLRQLGNFDGNECGDVTEYDVLPAGTYTVIVEESDVRDTKDGRGKYVAVTLQVVEGQYKGRKIFEMFQIRNLNQTAQDIGLKQFKALRIACGKLTVSDTVELHGIPVLAEVVIKDDATYGKQNKVKKYSAYVGAPAVQAPAAPTQQQPAFTPPPRAPWGG